MDDALWIVVLIVIAFVCFVIFNQEETTIDILKYRADAFEKQNDHFANQIRDLKTHLEVACAFRDPADGGRVNWTDVCGGT